MADPEDETKVPAEVVRAGLSESEMHENLVRLAFGGDAHRLEEFCAEIGRAVPVETAVVLRGSSVTGERWEDGAPFDAEGPGSSDLDVTLVGKEVVEWFEEGGFYIPGHHTKPLSEDHPDIAPPLVSIRERLTAMVGRPVNIQATRDWVMFVREHLMGQPYLTLIGKLETS